jgi:hypothetical protein
VPSPDERVAGTGIGTGRRHHIGLSVTSHHAEKDTCPGTEPGMAEAGMAERAFGMTSWHLLSSLHRTRAMGTEIGN